MFGLFEKKKTPRELVTGWTREIRKQQRQLDRQLAGMKADEKKAERSIRQLAKSGDTRACKILAKELVRNRRQRERLATSKAQLNSITMELRYQLSKLELAGSLQKSTQVMRSVNQLMSLPQLHNTLMGMTKEMAKAGVIDEMTEDMMEALDDEDLEEEAEAEVDKVLAEVTEGLLGSVKDVPTHTAESALAHRPDAVSDAESEPDLEEMQRRLDILRS